MVQGWRDELVAVLPAFDAQPAFHVVFLLINDPPFHKSNFIGSLLAVTHRPLRALHILLQERAAYPLLGSSGYGAMVNGYVRDESSPGGLRLWVRARPAECTNFSRGGSGRRFSRRGVVYHAFIDACTLNLGRLQRARRKSRLGLGFEMLWLRAR